MAHPIRAEYVQHLIIAVTVSSSDTEYSTLLLHLLEKVSPHVQILELHLSPWALHRRNDEERVVNKYLELLDQLSARIKHWSKLLELHLPVTSGRGMACVRDHLGRAPRLHTLALRPLRLRLFAIGMDDMGIMSNSTRSRELDLSRITSIAIVPYVPPGRHARYDKSADGPLMQTCDQIDAVILAQVPNLERLVIGQNRPYTPSQLERVLKGLPKLKELYYDNEPASFEWQKLAPNEYPIETLWLGLISFPEGGFLKRGYQVSISLLFEQLEASVETMS